MSEKINGASLMSITIYLLVVTEKALDNVKHKFVNFLLKECVLYL